ncbi:hypothetical protein GCM10027162_36690 [Streptomyces incanus]
MRMRSVFATTALAASAVLGSAATASADPAPPPGLTTSPFEAAEAILNGALDAGENPFQGAPPAPPARLATALAAPLWAFLARSWRCSADDS